MKFYNRDLSWLRFNHRVLQEIMDTRNPLFERLRFAAIFSSNLDEFFAVRIAEIRRLKSLDKPLRKKLISKPNKLLKLIKKGVNNLEKEFNEVLFTQLIPELNKTGINFVLSEKFDDEILSYCFSYFDNNLKDKLQFKRKFVTEEDRLFVKTGEVYFAGEVEGDLILFNLPADLPRFIVTEDGHSSIIFLDDLIKLNLEKKYSSKFYSVSISRDAELYIEDEFTGNLKDKIEKSLANREVGQISTAMLDEMMPKELKKLIFEELDISETDKIYSGKYQKLKDFFSFPFPSQPSHEYVKLPQIRSSELSCENCLFSAIKDKDRVLYFPYESFEEVVRFVNQAAVDEDVEVIKMTLYRVSKDSQIAHALLKALENGKELCVFIETKARFDESNNIYWGEKLKAAGANVIYSYPAIKVHSKILYIERKEESGTKAYGYIGTGNFNEKTSKIYTDFGLMTADKKITKELRQVFEIFERKLIIPKVKRLLVSPFNTRSKFTQLIENEIENANNGLDAYIILKMNSLQDRKMIEKLYLASNAGVNIKLIVRGICCLIPGVKGFSENISVTSIVDRYLEHARVYIFGNGGEEKMYIGSADWMTRNLDFRIEVVTPIKNKDCFSKIRNTIDLQLADQVKARIIDAEQSNLYKSMEGVYTESSQHNIYASLNKQVEALSEE